MKSVLIPVEDHALMGSALELALMLARRFDSYMEGAATGPDAMEFAAADYALSGVLVDSRLRRDFVDHGRRLFEDFMQDRRVARRRDDESRPSYGWLGEAPISDSGVGEYGRVFDMIVLGRPGAGPRLPRKSTLEAALFESGRPVLIAPPEAPATLGQRIAVIWNGATETARTIAFAMPLLLSAQDVAVLTPPGLACRGPSDEQLVKSLRRHGAPARVCPVEVVADRSSGASLLAAAEALGSDLVIKGGYTRSRLRQFIFGEVTSEILAESTLPVLMAH